MTRAPLRLVAIGALAAATALSAVLGLAALNAGGEARLGPLVLLKVGAGYDRRAERLTAAGFAPTPAQRAEVVALSEAALSQYPYDTAARLRLAYVDAIADNRLSPQGLAALRRSYDLIPVDLPNGVWRVGFALNYAGQLPPDLQAAVRNEVAVLMRNPQRRRQFTEMSHTLPNRVGRFWLALWLRQLAPRVQR